MGARYTRRDTARVLLGTAIGTAAAAGGAFTAAAEAPHGRLAAGRIEAFRADLVVVDKAKRTLRLFQAGRAFRAYRVRLGFAPVGPKRRRGDGRTPEGYYVIEGRRYDSRFGLALRIDYPREADLAEAAALGLDPGGGIYIHGFPPELPGFAHLHRLADWTDGCIAVTDDEMAELFRLIPDGTAIVIRA